jgi:transposase InsO family protein
MSLGKFYYDPEHRAGFGTVSILVKARKKNRKYMQEWLSAQDTYALHKQVGKRFPRNPYTVTNIDDVWEMDLADLTSLSKYNDGNKFLLNIIDVFSRYTWSVPLKDKTGASVTTPLKTLFKSRQPLILQSDKGTDFLNKTVQRYLKTEDVSFHTTHNPDIKDAIIERFNKTLKTRMYRYFTKNNTYRYLGVLDKLVQGYNNSIHSTI